MYEVSCRDLGVTDCDFDLMAYSLERLELDIIAHARYCHPGVCAAVDADPDSAERAPSGSGSSRPPTRSPPSKGGGWALPSTRSIVPLISPRSHSSHAVFSRRRTRSP